MKNKLQQYILQAVNEEYPGWLAKEQADLVHPTKYLKFGDYQSAIALLYALDKPESDQVRKDFANKIRDKILSYDSVNIQDIKVEGPGLLNFYLSKDFFKNSLGEIIEKSDNFGRSDHAKGFKVMVEHTDPNPFKEFHIGHLMPNVIGSTLARVMEWNGADVKQVNYQGDKGLHVAKAVWAILKGMDDPYVKGSLAYDEGEEAKKEIEEINKKIYTGEYQKINEVYEQGRKESLEAFEKIYERLGTRFDFYFFESETAPIGEKIVRENVGKVFQESDGAIVFKGEDYDPSLHTRVFINSQGIPTYEAKDLGNAKNKFDHYPYDLSVVVTGNEIREYFKVVLRAMQEVLPDLAKKTKHLPHGMLRLPSGKMSSRTGNIITAEELIEEVKEKVKGDEDVAIAAIKYMILRQAIGNDIIFDFEKSVSTEGDSGVYLQYAHARANSILEKAGRKGDPTAPRENIHEVEKYLYRFPEVVERAGAEYAPHYLVLYLTELASAFNNFYAHEPVLEETPESPYRLAIVEAFKIVMKNGLNILGIVAPERL